MEFGAFVDAAIEQNEDAALTVNNLFFSMMRYLTSAPIESKHVRTAKKRNPQLRRQYLLSVWYDAVIEAEMKFKKLSSLTRQEGNAISKLISDRYNVGEEMETIKLDDFERKLDRDSSSFLAKLKLLQPAELNFFFTAPKVETASSLKEELERVRREAQISRQEQQQQQVSAQFEKKSALSFFCNAR